MTMRFLLYGELQKIPVRCADGDVSRSTCSTRRHRKSRSDDTFEANVLARAIELSPLRRAGVVYAREYLIAKGKCASRGRCSQRNRYREAVGILETYAAKEPTLPVPQYTLVTLYYNLGDTATAKKWADEAYPLRLVPGYGGGKTRSKILSSDRDWQHAVSFLTDLVADDPANYDVRCMTSQK